jgi:hypothetical protein
VLDRRGFADAMLLAQDVATTYYADFEGVEPGQLYVLSVPDSGMMPPSPPRLSEYFVVHPADLPTFRANVAGAGLRAMHVRDRLSLWCATMGMEATPASAEDEARQATEQPGED